MPNTRTENAVRLEFAPDSLVQSNLSGTAFTGDWLRVAGSDGLKRKDAKPDRNHTDNAKRLAKVALDGHRRLLACLPIEPDAKGRPCLVRRAQDGRRALRPKVDAQTNLLTRTLVDGRCASRFAERSTREES